MKFRDELTEASNYKFVIFNTTTFEPADVAKTRKEAEDRIKIFKNVGRKDSYKIENFKKITTTLEKMGDPDGKLQRIKELVIAKDKQNEF